MGGAKTTYPTGVYGTKGAPAPTNFPGGRREGATWTDQAGNFLSSDNYKKLQRQLKLSTDDN
jgi:hypothetical protein